MDKIVEFKDRVSITESKRTGGKWLSYSVKMDDIPYLKDHLEEEYGVIIEPGDVDFLIKDERTKEIEWYPCASFLNKVATVKHISTKIEMVKMTQNPHKMVMVKATAVMPNGEFHEEFGYCDSTEPGRGGQVFSNILGMAETRARNRVLRIAIKSPNCSAEEMPPESQKLMKDLTDEILTICSSCKEKGWSRLQKKCTICNITHEEIIRNRQEEL